MSPWLRRSGHCIRRQRWIDVAIIGLIDGADDALGVAQRIDLLELLRRHLGRCAHQQVLGALVHREQHDLAQVLFRAQ